MSVLALSAQPAFATDGSKPAATGDANAPVRVLAMPRLDRAPTLEDFLEMQPAPGVAQQMAKAAPFIQRDPRDGEPATQRTEAYLGYDDKQLYVVFVAFDSDPQQIRARMSRRENAFDDDFVEITLDTFKDQRRGYLFWANPLGVQADALWSESAGGPDWSYDTLWHSRGQRTAQGFVVWMAIPFRSLRFTTAEAQTWGVTLTRTIPRLNEWTFWPYVSAKMPGRLNQAGTLEGLNRISPGRNIQVIPYGTFRAFRALDQRDPAAPRFTGRRAQVDGGVDAKFVFRDSLVFDVTVNPDFSQVESDQPQVTANQRFEVFFPEKRPFFLENSSFFRTPINLLFTRRIADPQFGARLTGKIGKYAIGALVADDQSPGRRVAPGDPREDKRALFSVLRVSRDIFDESSIGVMFTDREFDGSFNRVGGVDSRLRFAKNWTVNAQALTSSTRFLDGTTSAGPAYSAALWYSGRKFVSENWYNDYSRGFVTLAGFTPRTDIRDVGNFHRYSFRPEGKWLIAWGPMISSSHVFDHQGARLDRSYRPAIFFEMKADTFIEFFHRAGRERLRPADFGVLSAPRDFPHWRSGVFFSSSYFKRFNFFGDYRFGRSTNFVPAAGQQPASADETLAALGVTLRPISPLRIDNRYIFSRLLHPADGRNIFNNHIVRQSWNWQFNRELSLRLILQYDALLANPLRTSLETRKNFNADFLITYLLHPGTALYVGYNSNLQNIDLVSCVAAPGSPATPGCSAQLLRTNGFINDARGFFAKFSYVFRF